MTGARGVTLAVEVITGGKPIVMLAVNIAASVVSGLLKRTCAEVNVTLLGVGLTSGSRPASLRSLGSSMGVHASPFDLNTQRCASDDRGCSVRLRLSPNWLTPFGSLSEPE